MQDAHRSEDRVSLETLSKSRLIQIVLAERSGKWEDFTIDRFDYVCSQLLSGRSARSVFENDPANEILCPSSTTFYRWLANSRLDEMFNLQEKYKFCMQVRAFGLFDEMIEIARGHEDRDKIKIKHPKTGEVMGYKYSSVPVLRDRLLVDTIKWAIQIMAPKVYGEKSDSDTAASTEVHTKVVNLHPGVDIKELESADG